MESRISDASFWIASTEATAYPRLTEDGTADVVVIGAGIAGLCTAWEVLKTGRTVAVLEADRVAAGVTGHTTAKLTALHTLVYSRLAATVGLDGARAYARTQQEAVDDVERTARELDIDCDFERVPAFTYAETEEHAVKVRDEADAAAAAGLAASFVTDTRLPFVVRGAVRVDDQAQFHPRKYLIGLAEAIVARGGRIYERTRVVGLDEGAPCRVRTEDGTTMTTGAVVVATHYPVFDRALLFTRLESTRELVVGARLRADDDLAGCYVTPEGRTRSLRTAPLDDGHRLLIVTGEKFTPGADGVADRFDTLLRWTRERFPDAEPMYRWAAQDNSTPDHRPFIGPLHPLARNTYVATGFAGWGMSNGVVAGRLLAQTIDGKRPEYADLYDPRRLHPLREAPQMAKLATTVARHLVGDRLGCPRGDSPDELAPGTGAVLRVRGQRCAVYRDDDGELHAVSATCTHLGCIVSFNDAERAWECPCHGSRFTVDGAVLHGPATRPLPPQDLA